MDEQLIASYVKRILSARVYDVAIETPLQLARKLTHRLQNQIFIKREDQQPVFSFKLRGAYNKLIHLPEAERVRGVITASAGNHAQGLAYSCQKLGVSATIVMPRTTPLIKVEAVQSWSAEVILFGDTFAEAYAHSQQIAAERQLVYVHPYDDPDTIAGQGTIAREILQQHPDPIEAIFVPVGGGGMIAGISAYVKYLRPEIRIIGVEADDSACLKSALDAGYRVILPEVGLFADGVAVAQIGEHTFELAKQCVDEVITVKTDEICSAVKDMFDDTRVLFEPAGALALAGLKKYVQAHQMQDKTLIVMGCGANVNFDRLRYIAERAEIGEKKEALLAAEIAEQPGSFLAFCQQLQSYNITEFNYRYSPALKNNCAQVFVGLAMPDRSRDLPSLIARLSGHVVSVMDLSENDMAISHVRHMVGGRVNGLPDEKLFRFQFPERPGALLNFLRSLGSRWNISLFHYRNHGAAFGQVLVGLQVADAEQADMLACFQTLGYPYWPETDNPAYQLFLR
jgi:threonine dehydratase